MGFDTWQYWYSKKEGTQEPEIPKLEELLRKRGKSRVLDFGCGTGRHTVYFARKGFDVYGFEVSGSAVERARQLLRDEDLKANLQVLDMTQPLPYSESFFDAVVAVRVLHHTYMSNITRIVSEIDRVLKPSGYLFLQVPCYESETFDSETIWAEPGTLIARGGPEKGVPHHFFKKDELLGILPGYIMKEIHSRSDHYGGFCLIARKVAG